jgi:putative CocE/NonD family hydrolase
MTMTRARARAYRLALAFALFASCTAHAHAPSARTPVVADAAPAAPTDDTADRGVKFTWGAKIPLRDGTKLHANVYLPDPLPAPAPCLFTLTPYVAQSYHDRGMYFAKHGYPFLTVDARGRGNSEGTFAPFLQEADDGHDVVEWLAKQPYCNGKVSMWGGSYAGYNQWMTATRRPPSLATIVPVASPYASVDFPMTNGIAYPYAAQWLAFTAGRAAQSMLFGDDAFWADAMRRWVESGRPFREFDSIAGVPSPTFQEWAAHPYGDPYWDRYNPTPAQYASIRMPVLTVTGMYDGDQPGALRHYAEHLRHSDESTRAQHYLVIGPWDHAGTRTPQAEFAGMKFGPASLVDLPKLHLEWYEWTMRGGPKPEFLRKRVAYYVTGAETWRYADSLEAVTATTRTLYLDSAGAANDVYASGRLQDAPGAGRPDAYVYDPNDTSLAKLEAGLGARDATDQRLLLAASGRVLVYHSPPLPEATEISGFFRFDAWLAIDQPDTDFLVAVDEVLPDGRIIPLSTTAMRARYREGARPPKLVRTREPLKYEFRDFTFASRLLAKGSRLRLVVSPALTFALERNRNSGGVVANESAADARAVKVSLYHDRARPSALHVPIGAK